MTGLILILAISCPRPELVGDSFKDPLGQFTIKRASLVCLDRYKGCLVRLSRKGLDFRAICKRYAK